MGAVNRFNFQRHLKGFKGVLKWGLIILFLLPGEFLSAQPFEVIVNLLGIQTVEKVTYDLHAGECSEPEVIASAYFDPNGLAHCPNGQVFAWRTSGSGGIYRLDEINGELIYYSPIPAGLPGLNPGLICLEDDIFIVKSNDSYHLLDLIQDTIINMAPTGFGDDPVTGWNLSGLTLLNGKGYRAFNDTLTPTNLGIVEFDPLDPSNSSLVVETGGIPDFVSGLAPTPYCNILIGSAGPLVWQDMSAWVFNVATGDYYKLCDYDWFRNIVVMTTPYEHEDQYCDLIINLDYFEETDAEKYDYLNPEPYTCLSEGAAIAHEVVFIATDATIDFMTVELIEPLPDGAQEYLSVDGNVSGITVSGNESQSLLLTNDGSANTQSYRDILQIINYHNDAAYPTEGRRNIEVQFTTINGESSNVATGMVDVEELDIVAVDLGEDIQICEGESHLIESNIQQGTFQWSTGQTTPAITVSQEQYYSLTVSDGIHCPGVDSVYLEVFPIVELSLFYDPLVCFGESANIVITSNSEDPIDFKVSDQFGNIYAIVEGMVNSHSFNITLTEPLNLFLFDVFSEADICIEYANATAEISVLPTYEINLTDTLCQGESLFFINEWLDYEGQFTKNLETEMGCDSIISLHLTIMPTDSIINSIWSCSEGAIDTSIVVLENQYGCDSVVMEIVEFYPPDETFITTFSCHPGDEELIVDTLTNQLGCDSLVYTGVLYIAADSTYLIEYSCELGHAGIFTDTLTNSYGCDSLIFREVIYIPADSIVMVEYSCDESDAEVDIGHYSNQYGCDSVVVSIVEYLSPDTTLIMLTSCDPADEGTLIDTLTNSFGCDSLVITETSFTLTDSTFLTVYSCDASEEGLLTDSLLNAQGCDSLVFTQIVYSPPDTVYVNESSCDPDETGTTEIVLQNSLGCDSLVIVYTALLPSDTVYIAQTSCDPDEAGTHIHHYTNQWGCDSMVIIEVELLPSDEVFLYESSCDPQQTGVFTANYINQYGCDSVVVTEVDLLLSDTVQIMNFTCEAGQLDSTWVVYQNQYGCDSLVLSVTMGMESPEAELLSVGDYNGYDLSCAGASDGILTVLAEGGVPPYELLWEDGSTHYHREGLSAGTYSITLTDVNDCYSVDSIELRAAEEFQMELTITHPACFDDQTGGIIVTANGGVAPFTYRLNQGAYEAEGVFDGLGPGLYELSIRDANGCEVHEAVLIQSPEQLSVSLGEDQEVVPGDSILLEVITNVPYDSLKAINWKGLQNPDCTDCPRVYDRPLVSTTYSVTITDRAGCMASDEMRVDVVHNRNIYVPNAFSPNGDGINDYFTIYADDRQVKSIQSLQIFSRYGDRVFHRTEFAPNQPELGWDGYFRGELMNPAVFVWTAEVEFLDGELLFLTGDVVLVR